MFNFSSAFSFLVDTFFNLYLAAILLRIILQYIRAPFNNPIGEFVISVTNPLVQIFRKIIPGFYGIDFASLTAAYLVAILKLMLINIILFHFLMPHVGFLVTYLIDGVLTLISISLSICFWSILLLVIFSFIAQGYQLNNNPVYYIAYLIAEPILRPIRKTIPPIGGFDLSPLFACILISVLKILFNV